MNCIFENFQITKLPVDSPEFTNIILMLIFALLVFITTNLKQQKNAKLLSYRQTEQIKGIAIFLVVLGHLWVHVAVKKPSLIFAGDAVSIFLILSGFGLTLSSRTRKMEFTTFFSRRISRVMIPYWLATLIILFLDYILLNRIMDVRSLIMTFAGINISLNLKHLDYARWFVTFILLWYVIFFFIDRYIERKIFGFLALAFILIPLNYYLFHFGWYQFFSFPIGCVIANFYDNIIVLWDRKKNTIVSYTIIVFMATIFYKLVMGNISYYNFLVKTIPNIVLIYMHETNSILFCCCVIIFISFLSEKGFESKFLLILGRYSYELFLIHGAFLIKYNPFFKAFDNFPIMLPFYFYLLFVVGFAFCLSRISLRIYAK